MPLSVLPPNAPLGAEWPMWAFPADGRNHGCSFVASVLGAGAAHWACLRAGGIALGTLPAPLPVFSGPERALATLLCTSRSGTPFKRPDHTCFPDRRGSRQSPRVPPGTPGQVRGLTEAPLNPRAGHSLPRAHPEAPCIPSSHDSLFSTLCPGRGRGDGELDLQQR